MTEQGPDDLMSAVELAHRLGVKPGTILAWHRKGRIPSRRLSHKLLRFGLADVLSALEARQKSLGEADGRGGDL
jgi:predicted site-specific integrase-resolvase